MGIASAETRVYAVVIGNNSPPVSTELKTLRYADDDAVRYFNFFKRFSNNVHLMTVADRQTQRRYTDVSSLAIVPTLSNFEITVRYLSGRIEVDRASGHTSVLYFAFSGHGAYQENGDPYLALVDSALTHERIFDALVSINADYTHLFVDACYAEGVVGARGMFDKESDTQHILLSDESVQQLIGEKRAFSLPGLGVIMASSEYQKTHEWSQIESGIFTHEILSGLSGPADINLDGKIEYSELVAFVSAANRDIKDERGRVRVIARPPPRDERIALVNLAALDTVAFLTGDATSLRHFTIERENGERYLDANLEGMKKVNIIVPADEKVYLLAGEKEAVLRAGPGSVTVLAMLSFEKQRYNQKGNIETSLQKGFFSAGYNVSYYRGFVDSTGFSSVSFQASQLTFANVDAAKSRFNLKKSLSIASFIVAGSAAISATVFGVLALSAKKDFSNTRLEIPSLDARDRYRRNTAIFWPLLGVVPAAALAGLLLMPRRPAELDSEKKHAHLAVLRDGVMSLSLEF